MSGIKTQAAPRVSVIIPGYNEEENIPLIHQSLVETFDQAGVTYELIFVNDGSKDKSESILNGIVKNHPHIIALHMLKNRGKAAAVEAGVQYARGKAIVIIDCDMQYDPKDVVRLLQELDNGFDMASARRMNREDNSKVRFTSKIFNSLIRKMTGLNFADYFSGLKCFNREVVNYLALYGELYRFAVVYAYVQGFKVTEVPVQHYARAGGVSRYNTFRRMALSVGDVLTVLMTVVLSQDRVYYLNLIGLFLLAVGVTLGALKLFVPLAVFFIWFGLITLILKKMSSDFFDRHLREFSKRKKNLRSVVHSASYQDPVAVS